MLIDEEGYYLASYRDGPEIVKVIRVVPEGALVVLRHGFSRSYRLDYFTFHSRVTIEVIDD